FCICYPDRGYLPCRTCRLASCARLLCRDESRLRPDARSISDLGTLASERALAGGIVAGSSPLLVDAAARCASSSSDGSVAHGCPRAHLTRVVLRKYRRSLVRGSLYYTFQERCTPF